MEGGQPCCDLEPLIDWIYRPAYSMVQVYDVFIASSGTTCSRVNFKSYQGQNTVNSPSRRRAGIDTEAWGDHRQSSITCPGD